MQDMQSKKFLTVAEILSALEFVDPEFAAQLARTVEEAASARLRLEAALSGIRSVTRR